MLEKAVELAKKVGWALIATADHAGMDHIAAARESDMGAKSQHGVAEREVTIPIDGIRDKGEYPFNIKRSLNNIEESKRICC